MTAASPIPVPSQQKLEQLAGEYRDLEKQLEDKLKAFTTETAPIGKRLGELKKILIEDVRNFGSAHQKKSKILYAQTLEIMATFGSSSSTDNAAVEAFRLGLKKAGRSKLLKKIFTQTIRWDLKSDAALVISLAHEAGKLPNKLFKLFVACTVTKDSSPRLEVRPKQQSQTA